MDIINNIATITEKLIGLATAIILLKAAIKGK